MASVSLGQALSFIGTPLGGLFRDPPCLAQRLLLEFLRLQSVRVLDDVLEDAWPRMPKANKHVTDVAWFHNQSSSIP